MEIVTIYGSKGYNHGQFNKIRDIETFTFNDDHLLLVVDHRNHRLELFKINNILEFEYLTTYNGGNETFCLPANILYIGNGMFICSEVQDNERIQIISIYQENGVYKIKQHFTLIGCKGPGGMSLYKKNIIFIPEYMSHSIYICRLFNNNFSLNPLDRFTNEHLQNPIDSIIIRNKLFIIDCKKIDKSKDKSIIIFNINESNFNLEYETEITEAFGLKFNFSYSAGAISTCNFEGRDYILIADSENDRILVAIITFNQYNNVIIEFQTQFKNNILFPTSICVGQDNIILCSCFHHYGKTELYDHDKIICLRFDQLVKKELILNKVTLPIIPCILEEEELNNNEFLDYMIINKVDKISDKISNKIFITSSNKIITLIKINDYLYLDTISFNHLGDIKKINLNIDSLIDIDLDDNLNLPPSFQFDENNMMKLIFLNDRRHILRRFNPENLHKYLISLTEDKINYKENNFNGINYQVFTYNSQIQMKMIGWTLGLLSTRGLVMNNLNGWNIVATPFPKFWNSGGFGQKSTKNADRSGIEVSFLNNELKKIGGQFYLEEKVDGSLAIIFWNGTDWIATTKGSFNSPQGIEASRWIKDYDIILPDKNTTYLMEIVSPINKLVVDYKQSALVLLAGYNKLGYELKSYELDDIIQMQNNKIETRLFKRTLLVETQKYIDSANMKITNPKLIDSIVFRRPIQTVNLQSYEEAASMITKWPCNYEGMVAIWNYNNGTSYRIKIKTNAFCDLQQAIKKYTPAEATRIYINDPNEYDEWALKADEEYYEILIKWKKNMDANYEKILDEIKSNLYNLNSKYDLSDKTLNKNKYLDMHRRDYTYVDELFKIINSSLEDQSSFNWTKDKSYQKLIRRYILLEVKNDDPVIDKNEENNGDGKTLIEFMNDIFNHIYEIVSKNLDLTIIKMNQYLKEHYSHIFHTIDKTNKVYIIKYIEGSNIWTSWSRKARGTVLYLDDKLHFRILKQLLDRGAEILTTTHIKQNILSTQDISTYSDVKHNFLEFTRDQQNTMNMIIANEKFPGYLTMKVDGSLSAINVYRKGTSDCIFIEHLIDTLPIKFYKIIKNLCNSIEYLIIPSSQGTLFIDYETMINNDKLKNWRWNIGAIICGFLNINENEVKQNINSILKNL
jgi:hypothetical protein